MRPLSDTLVRLKRLANRPVQSEAANSPLRPFGDFGSNPGQLKAWLHVPRTAKPGAPLVVVLHGCTQTAAGYDASAGWSRLADQHGFLVLYPEQQRSNNPNLCFTWFSPADTTRGQGEALSIRQMVTAVRTLHHTDPSQVFVTGLSAGGAMTAVMLATYPDVFAGGGVVAGLPYGVARTVPEAFDRMRAQGGPEQAALANLVRDASRHSGSWPRLSVWHGTADHTVDHANADQLIAQWQPLHDADPAAARTETVHGQTRRVWRNAAGQDVIEAYSIAGLGHGTPLATGMDGHGETAGPFMLEAGISSTRLMAQFWGIVPKGKADVVPVRADTAETATDPQPTRWARPQAAQPGLPASNVQQTIENALRSAGLMK